MLTPEKREALLRARVILFLGHESYICHALNHVGRECQELEVIAHSLATFVGDAVGRDDDGWSNSLESWQIDNGFGRRSRDQTRQDRLDWIDWMLNDNPPDPVQVGLHGVSARCDETYYL